MVGREAVGDSLEAEGGVTEGGGGVAEKAAVDKIGDEEGDVDAAGVAEDLGQAEHGVDMALDG